MGRDNADRKYPRSLWCFSLYRKLHMRLRKATLLNMVLAVDEIYGKTQKR